MPVQLTVTTPGSRISAHEGLRLHCSLSSEGAPPLEIPSPYDRSGSFNLLLRNGGGDLVRVLNRQVRQAVMSGGRVDGSLDLDVLQPGETWEWDMDLASYHYPLPPGTYSVGAVYEYEPAELRLEAGPIPIRVSEDPVRSLTVVRDNPVLDGLAMLFEADGETGTEFYLRMHNYSKPVGAWWSAPILAGEDAEGPFCATANFFQAESVDQFDLRWVVWTSGGSVHARCFDEGEATGRIRTASLPEDCTLIRQAVRTIEDELYVFLWSPAGAIECHRLGEHSLTRVFEHRTRSLPGSPIAIGADESSIHIVSHWRGILYDRLSFSGRLLDRFHVFRTRLRPVSLEFEPGELRIKGLFRDGDHGKMVQMVVVDVAGDLVTEYSIGRMPVRGDVIEIAFDQDRKARFHMLFSTGEKKLYYYSEGRGPVLVAEGEDRFFPVVAAPLKVYLGCYRRDYGYRFLQYQRRRHGTKITGREAHS